LTLGLNLNDLDSTTDRTALGTYAFHGNTEACRILLDAKNPKTGDSANGIAKQRGDTVMLKVRQEAGAL
jgi:hypothetical protein